MFLTLNETNAIITALTTFQTRMQFIFFQLPRIFTILNHKKNNFAQPEVISPTREHLAVSNDISDGHD